jgi:Predicted membrane protein
MDITSLVIAWLVTSVSFFIISKLPLGVEIDSFEKAMISAAVFGLLNALVRPLFVVFSFPFVLTNFWFVYDCDQCCYLWISGLASAWISLAVGNLECFAGGDRPRFHQLFSLSDVGDAA